ncbi:unnamed protein product [Phytomonas sp. Hart1]|nr:unnamed protein product [Phytomonas sp. Hart1]|eukprot:CCW71098.1 unnamed protein product [Phytomonas sp. isolate Hart1]
MALSSDLRSAYNVKNKKQDIPLPPVIDVMQNRYPFCIVWAPIPFISWIFPFIGHVAICDSEGRIYDFQGDFHVGTDRMLFGRPLKYWDLSKFYVPSFYNPSKDMHQIDSEQVQDEIDAYNSGISLAKGQFTFSEHYNFFTNNCHSFVADCLNKQTICLQKSNMFSICLGMVLHSKYTSMYGCAIVFAPPIILVVLLIIIISCC